MKEWRPKENDVATSCWTCSRVIRQSKIKNLWGTSRKRKRSRITRQIWITKIKYACTQQVKNLTWCQLLTGQYHQGDWNYGTPSQTKQTQGWKPQSGTSDFRKGKNNNKTKANKNNNKQKKSDRVQDSYEEQEFWMTRLDWAGIRLNQFEMFEEHENCLSRMKTMLF